MRKISFLAVAAALIAIGAGGWTVTTTRTVGGSTDGTAITGINPSALTTAKDLPTFHFVDYSMVFN